MSDDRWRSPLGARYASPAMQILWGEPHRIGLWRRLWLALAEVLTGHDALDVICDLLLSENLGVAQAMGPWRGRWGDWRGIPVLPTYHPAYLLRSPEQKRVVWEDLQLVMKRFDWKRA